MFMSLSALLCSHTRPVHTWTQYTVDSILEYGDRLCLNSLERGGVPDTGTFSVNDLPAEAETLDGITYMIEYKSYYQGYITNSGLIDESVPYILDLYESLTNTFAISDHAFLIFHGYAMAIFKSIYYYVFDSHSRDCNGMPAPNGTAVLMEFHDLSNLKDYICMLSIALNTSYFEIVPVTFTKQIIHCEQQTTCSNSSPGSRTPYT